MSKMDAENTDCLCIQLAVGIGLGTPTATSSGFPPSFSNRSFLWNMWAA